MQGEDWGLTDGEQRKLKRTIEFQVDAGLAMYVAGH